MNIITTWSNKWNKKVNKLDKLIDLYWINDAKNHQYHF